MFSHRIHGIHRTYWQRVFSHRIHGIHRTDWQRCSPTEFTEFTEQTCRDVLPQNSQILTDGVCLEFCEFCVFCGTSHAPVNLCKYVQSVGGLFWLRGVYPPTEQTDRDVLPQNSQILTDGACLEFCEFCVFCGTSYAPSESAICGRIIWVAWVIALLVPSSGGAAVSAAPTK